MEEIKKHLCVCCVDTREPPGDKVISKPSQTKRRGKRKNEDFECHFDAQGHRVRVCL